MTVTVDDAPRTAPGSGARPRRRLPLALKVFGAFLALFLLYFGITFMQVWAASRQDDAQPAQAIIVLGTAQYNGTPSKALAARLDHAIELFERGLAPLIVVTGGNQPGDLFTEAEASANYLQDHGIPGDKIERETTSTNTYDELAATSLFLTRRGITEVLLVSDPFHAYRIADIAGGLGMHVHVSPTPSSVFHGFDKLKSLVRETVAVGAGRIVGYDRLDRIQDDLNR
jgi:uncharacterized SAM-binding protein YcdF (DUF218 family)